jgi:hypothetical protein
VGSERLNPLPDMALSKHQLVQRTALSRARLLNRSVAIGVPSSTSAQNMR